jgi:hypothetical protein
MELKQKFNSARVFKRHVAVLTVLATAFCSFVYCLWYYPHTSFISLLSFCIIKYILQPLLSHCYHSCDGRFVVHVVVSWLHATLC